VRTDFLQYLCVDSPEMGIQVTRALTSPLCPYPVVLAKVDKGGLCMLKVLQPACASDKVTCCMQNHGEAAKSLRQTNRGSMVQV